MGVIVYSHLKIYGRYLLTPHLLIASHVNYVMLHGVCLCLLLLNHESHEILLKIGERQV